MNRRSTALTDREVDILRLIAIGKRNKEIASQLCISEATVENHLHRIFGKLEVSNRTEAALYAIQTLSANSPEN